MLMLMDVLDAVKSMRYATSLLTETMTEEKERQERKEQ